MTATHNQIAAIVTELTYRGIVANGRLMMGWGHEVGLPLPKGVNNYHDNPYIVFANLDNDGMTEMFRKLSINS